VIGLMCKGRRVNHLGGGVSGGRVWRKKKVTGMPSPGAWGGGCREGSGRCGGERIRREEKTVGGHSSSSSRRGTGKCCGA